MKLRSGKIINYEKNQNEKNQNVNDTCNICMEKYKWDDLLISCSRKNIGKHSFHENCFNTHKIINNNSNFCPYCLINIKRCFKLKYIKLIST